MTTDFFFLGGPHVNSNLRLFFKPLDIILKSQSTSIKPSTKCVKGHSFLVIEVKVSEIGNRIVWEDVVSYLS